MPTFTVPIIKHIPRSSRQHIAAELFSVLHHINSNLDDVSNWSALLEFGSIMLHASPRAGRHHALSDRNSSSEPSYFPTVQFTVEDVTADNHSFPGGSAGSPDGVRPRHLRDARPTKQQDPPLSLR